jgi:hypothetical protein
MGMANLRAGTMAGDDMATGVSGLFRTRYPEMVRLADLLGADDPEDIAQEAFARLLRKYDSLRDPDAALAYVRASVCNLTRNRHRHLRVVRLHTPTWRVFHYPAHVLEPTAGTMKAYLLDGRLVGVTGKVVGFWDSSSSSAIASRPASGSPVVVNMGGGIVNHAKLSEYYGVRPSPAAGRGGPGRRRRPR